MPKFGENLRQQRESREISLREISDATKIAVRYLEAIELSRFEALPGGVFNKGFIRAYANYVGLDGETMVAAYLNEMEQLTGPEVTGVAPVLQPGADESTGIANAAGRALRAGRLSLAATAANPEGSDRPGPSALAQVLWLVVGTALLFSALVTWRYLAADDPATVNPEQSASPVPRSAPSDPYDPAGHIVETSIASLTGGAEAPRLEPSERPPAAGSESPGVAPGSGFVVPADPSVMNLRIKARTRTWVRVICDGRELVNRRLRADEVQSLQCRDLIRLSASNVSEIRLTINGASCKPLAEPGSRLFGYAIRREDWPALCPPGHGSDDAGP